MRHLSGSLLKKFGLLSKESSKNKSSSSSSTSNIFKSNLPSKFSIVIFEFGCDLSKPISLLCVATGGISSVCRCVCGGQLKQNTIEMIINRFKNYSRLNFVAAAGSSGSGLLLFTSIIGKTVLAEEKVEPPKYPWSHGGLADSYDHARYETECHNHNY